MVRFRTQPARADERACPAMSLLLRCWRGRDGARAPWRRAGHDLSCEQKDHSRHDRGHIRAVLEVGCVKTSPRVEKTESSGLAYPGRKGNHERPHGSNTTL